MVINHLLTRMILQASISTAGLVFFYQRLDASLAKKKPRQIHGNFDVQFCSWPSSQDFLQLNFGIATHARFQNRKDASSFSFPALAANINWIIVHPPYFIQPTRVNLSLPQATLMLKKVGSPGRNAAGLSTLARLAGRCHLPVIPNVRIGDWTHFHSHLLR